jgi:D-lactate dehydrogenase (cytochrome)
MYGDYLKDESNFKGTAQAIFFPETAADMELILAQAREAGMDVTISAGRTGITGGAVPEGGWLVSLEKMNKFLGLRYDPENDVYLLTLQPGVRLSEVQEAVVARDFPGSAEWDEGSLKALDGLQDSAVHYFYPPDPTETDACLGGNAACNASGARTYKYGSTREYIQGLKVLLSDATVLILQRGTEKVGNDGRVIINTQTGRPIDLIVQEISMPDTKNAAGYYLKPGMDLVDLFIGSEGTLGIITELELKLVPAPVSTAEVVILLDSEDRALDLTEALRISALDVGSVEYLCPRAMRFLDSEGKLESFNIDISQGDDRSALIVSLEAGVEGSDDPLKLLTALLRDRCIDPVDTLVAMDAGDKERFKVFRHNLPESINETIAQVKTQYPEVTKLGMDFAVPFDKVRDMVKLYHQKLGGLGLDYVLFGHIGNGHVHVNIIPRDMEEYDKGKKVYRELALDAVALGGTVSGEHGIGKIKRDLLLMMYGEEDIIRMKAVKDALDPTWSLGQGTMFFMRGKIEDCRQPSIEMD